jgi:myosin heavy subunit
MGFADVTIFSLLRIVVGVLFAGNISFTPSRDGESCRLDKTDAALTCAKLLGISFEGLAAALTARVILAGDEVVHKPLCIESATKALEALIKAVYGAAFDFIVEKVNESIVEERSSQGTASIGVLDIFGFETFEVNSFEQLCINYTNEALQQQFNRYVFKLEQQEYEREGIMWKFIAFPDNQDVLDLIDKKHTGVLALLDEQCILPKSTDEKYTRYLYAKCDKHLRFSASSSQRVDYLFSIEHYAGLVEYNTDGWIEKNKDQLPAASSDLLKSSTFDFIGQIQKFVRGEDRAGRGTVATKSVSSQFSTQLRVLRSRIDETVPHYIRCLKPNDELAPHYFEPKNVVEQLRCGGVLEAVRVSRAGYPTRYPHDVFLARYYILGNTRDMSPQSPVFSPSSQTEKETLLKRLIASIAFDLWYAEHQVIMALLSAEISGSDANGPSKVVQKDSGRNFYSKKFRMHTGPQAPPFSLVVESTMMTPENQKKKKNLMRERDRHNVARPETVDEFNSLDFASRCAVAGLQLGRTKVFLRREAFDRIESMRSDKFYYAAATIQRMVRGKMMRDYYKLMRWAAIVIQSAMRMKLSTFEAANVRIIRSVIKIQSVWRCYSARMWLSEVMLARRYAATIIQRAYRMHAYRTFQPSEDDIIRAVTVIQAMHRGGKVRKMLTDAALEEIHQSTSKKAATPSPVPVEKKKQSNCFSVGSCCKPSHCACST